MYLNRSISIACFGLNGNRTLRENRIVQIEYLMLKFTSLLEDIENAMELPPRFQTVSYDK